MNNGKAFQLIWADGRLLLVAEYVRRHVAFADSGRIDDCGIVGIERTISGR
jgi:hypothetical protein